MTRSYQTIAVIVALCGLAVMLTAIGGVTAGEQQEQPPKAAASPATGPPAEPERHSVGQKNNTLTKESEEDEASDSDTSSEHIKDAKGRTADTVQTTPDDAVLVAPENATGSTRRVRGSELTEPSVADAPESRIKGGVPASPRPMHLSVGDGGVQPAGGGESRESRGRGGPRAPILDAATMKLSFQAFLTDNGGNALPGPTVDLEFNIYNAIAVVVEGPILMPGVPIAGGIVDVLVPVSASSFSGDERLLGVTVNAGPELTPRIPLVSVPHAIRVDRVENPELTDHVELGTATADGSLAVFNAGIGAPSVTVDGMFSEMRFYGFSNGLEGIRLFDRTFGEIRLYDESSDEVVRLSATGTSGGELTLSDASGTSRIFADGANASVNVDGEVNIVDGVGGTAVVELFQLNVGVRGGRMETFDELGTHSGIFGTSTVAGGVAELRQKDGDLGAVLDGDDTGNDGGGSVKVYDSGQTRTVELMGETGDLNATGDLILQDALGGTTLGSLSSLTTGARLDTYDELGVATSRWGSSAGSGGFAYLYQADSSLGIVLDGDAGTDAGGVITVQNPTGSSTVAVDGDDGDGGGRVTITDGTQETIRLDGSGAGGGAGVNLFNSLGLATIIFDADSTDAGYISVRDASSDQKVLLDVSTSNNDRGEVMVYDGAGTETVEIVGQDDPGGGGQGGRIRVQDSANSYRVQIRGEDTNGAGDIRVRDEDGTTTILMQGAEGAGQGSQIALYDSVGASTIEIDGDFNGDGRITTEELQITGGSDLSEQFDVRSTHGIVKPGMVVCIDPSSPGKLLVGNTAYDRTVAGIISGAGGVGTGMYMGQKGTPADGSHPVALTGRVYCWCDATNGAITPGDLLTTADSPGCAMKVTDHARAQGAIIGKAMTPLAEGRGLVLLLVTLQ